MSIFRVGMRVRIVSAPMIPKFIGLEARIISAAYGAYADIGDEWVISVNGKPYGAIGEHLEPILPPHEACDSYYKDFLDELVRGLEVAA